MRNFEFLSLRRAEAPELSALGRDEPPRAGYILDNSGWPAQSWVHPCVGLGRVGLGHKILRLVWVGSGLVSKISNKYNVHARNRLFDD